jgi:hypothetical protein
MAFHPFRSSMLVVAVALSPCGLREAQAQGPAAVRVSATVRAPEPSLGFQPDSTAVRPLPGTRRFRIGNGLLDVQSGAGSRVRVAPSDSSAVRVVVDYLGS